MSTELSYISSPRKTPYIYKTVIDLLQEEVVLNPDKECTIHRGLDGFRESLTYRDLDSKATSLAKILVSKGVKKGDNVALLGPNTLQKVIAEFGIILSGAAVLHLTMNMTDARDVLDIFTIARCRLLLLDPGRDQIDVEWIPRLLDAFTKNGNAGPPVLFLRSVENIPTRLDISGFCDMSVSVDLPQLYPEDIAWIFTTSGSTGKPKMVGHSHFSMTSTEADFMNGRKSNSGYIKVYNDRPFGWLAGCPSFPIIYRYIRVFTDSSTAMASNSTSDIWNIIKEERCTHAILLPYFLSDLIQMKDNYVDPFKLDFIVTGGQIIDKYFTHVIDVFTKRMMSVYGSTEILFVTLYPLEKTNNEVVVGDVGKPIQGFEVKIVDETGNVTRIGEQGEICIRSAGMFKGYQQDDNLNKHSFLEGHWFRIGDTGYITGDGRLIIQGRIKDIISRGTSKIMPAAIEEVILEMDGISNVAVVPVPDKRLYEEVCVCFTATNEKEVDEKSVKIFCEKQFNIENTADGLGERPAYYLKFECLPKLPTGKFDKGKIRREALDRLQRDEEPKM